jgi:hypothetical protein
MAVRFVKLPNEKIGMFSDSNDQFWYVNLSAEQARQLACDELKLNPTQAAIKVAEAERDMVNGSKILADGFNRWRDCLEAIECRYGENGLARLYREIGIRREPKRDSLAAIYQNKEPMKNTHRAGVIIPRRLVS